MEDIMKILALLLCLSMFTTQGFTQNAYFEKFALKELQTYSQLISANKEITDNQRMYDVKYYSLDLTPNPSKKILYGNVQVICEVLSTSLDSIELNFWDGMAITEINFSNSPVKQLTYIQDNDLLLIDLDSTFYQGETIDIIVTYHGSPQNSDYKSFSFTSYDSRPMIWTLSEPYGARGWWPCKDIPSDKPDSVDIKVTVPSEFIVASNGSLRETITLEDTTTYWWHEQYPIATYLVSLAIYPYSVYYDDYLYNNNTDTMKIHFYMFPDHVDYFQSYNSQVKDMISLFSELFGEYPFINEKYGNVEIFNCEHIAMEHQTCTSFDYAAVWNYPWWIEWNLNHELAHQWWGDLITCKDFHHIWLNEGFATYATELWFEYTDRPQAAKDYMMNTLLYLGEGTVFVENPVDLETIFIWELTYLKAAWVLHMLRHAVTDSVFFEILKTYGSSPLNQYGTATTEDFQSICEQVSGLDLEKFFHQWIYEEYYPVYYYNWIADSVIDGYEIDVSIRQNQTNTVPFWMPIDIKITTNSYDTIFVVWDSLESQMFSLFVPDKPLDINLDPDNWILKQKEYDPDALEEKKENHITDFILFQNYPNPFNPSTTIEFTLPKSEFVELKVYNILGKEISTIVAKKLNQGNYTYTLDGRNLASGIYYYRIQAGELHQVKKMILLK